MERKNNPIRGDIFLANLDPVVGSEQGKTRPVLVISNNLMNETAPVIIIIPLTGIGQKVQAGPFNISYAASSIELDKNGTEELRNQGYGIEIIDGVLLCNQGRTVSKNRLLGRIGKVSDRALIKQAELSIIHSYALDACEDCGIPLRPRGISCVRCGKIYRFKCIICGFIFSNEYNYCPKCGVKTKNE